jgi:hypothetical protein
MARKTVIVHVNDKMQRGYTYVLTARSGRNFDPEFRPELTPKEMLALGVFCGKYMTDCRDEFPGSWFARARLSPSGRDCSLNISASMPASRWRSGAARAGFIRTIRAAGSNGTAATTLGAACRRRTRGRSSGGRLFGATSTKSNGTASLVIPGVDRASAKLCCTGPMTAGRFEANAQGPLGGGATKFFENDCAHREGASSSSAWPRAK